MIVAFTGLQQSGKTTLFRAVSGKTSTSGGRGPVDSAVVPVPDARFDWLVDYYNPRKVTRATIECIDLPGIDPLTSEGAAMAKRILGAAREADMLVIVVRAFDGGAEASGPANDLETVRGELLLADLEMVEKRIEKLEKEVQKPTKLQQQKKDELAVQLKLRDVLERELPATEAELSATETQIVKSLGLLTMKPVMAVFNISDDAPVGGVQGIFADCPVPAVMVSAGIESELSLLGEEDRAEFMRELGMKESAAEIFVRSCYDAMGMISFLTVGEDEVRAWPVKKGTPALEAAGRIHSDIQRGFIRAETMAYEELISYGDEKALKAAGRVRLEGKEYIVRDGDIISYRFSV